MVQLRRQPDSSSFAARRDQGVRTSLRTDVTAPGVSEIFKEARHASSRSGGGCSARDSQVRSLPGDFETGAAVARVRGSTSTTRLDYYATPRAPQRRYQQDTLRRANTCPERLVVVVVGDQAKIEPGSPSSISARSGTPRHSRRQGENGFGGQLPGSISCSSGGAARTALMVASGGLDHADGAIFGHGRQIPLMSIARIGASLRSRSRALQASSMRRCARWIHARIRETHFAPARTRTPAPRRRSPALHAGVRHQREDEFDVVAPARRDLRCGISTAARAGAHQREDHELEQGHARRPDHRL